MKTLIERFNALFTPVTETGCWLWLGWERNGYGRIYSDGKAISAHRASWELHCGPIPAGMMVCHKCDTPPCVNPSHLFLGTHADNQLDKLVKGRGAIAIGERNGNAKLTATAALAIRNSSLPGVMLAAIYSITPTMVTRIRKGLAWTHLTEDSHNGN